MLVTSYLADIICMTPARRVRYATPRGQKGANGLGSWLGATLVQPETK